ncbi:MAG: hypothetical protein WA175_08495, partial [Candidatus Acidiferrales bacterium]
RKIVHLSPVFCDSWWRLDGMTFEEGRPRDVRMRMKRRGPRMNSRVPVTIEWNRQLAGPLHFEEGFTRVVNNYGCLLVSPKEVDVQQRLLLTNISTRQAAEGVVVWKGTQRPDGWDLGVQLVAADLNFWGVEL